VRRVVAVDRVGRPLHLYVHHTAADAASHVPDLLTGEADPDADRADLEAISDWAARFSPSVAPDPPDGLFLDITGVAHLWGGESALMADLLARLAAAGLPARGAVASTTGAAWAVAHFGQGFSAPGPQAAVIIPPGGEAAALRPLSIAALRCEPAAARQFDHLGITTIAQLMALPRDQVARRFGAAVPWRLDQALGEVPEALIFRRPAAPDVARLSFAEPISAPEDLARVTRDIALQLCARLETRGVGARCFTLAFHGVDGRARRLEVSLALAARDPAALARLFAPKLETVDPGFGLEVVTLVAEETAPLAGRQSRWDLGEAGRLENGRDDDAMAPLIDRLTNRLGEGAVWRAAPFPSHLPERASVVQAPLNPGQTPPKPGRWDPDHPRPLRLFTRPEPVEVTALAPDDPPRLFRWRGVVHRVRLAEGPERLAPEWWRAPAGAEDEGAARDYYQVENEAGARFWLFREGPYRSDRPARWWLHGLF
jgi:protein ImuB